MSRLTRRDVLVIGAGAVASGLTCGAMPVQAAGEAAGHGLSAFGDLKYSAGFRHLDYVNPDAPKGGAFNQLAGAGTATFNSLNGFILKGDPVKMLTTIYQVSQIINSILDLKELLNKVMDQATDLVGAERGLIFLYRSESDEMEMV